MKKLLTIDEFRSSAKDGARPDGTVMHVSIGQPKAYEDGSRKIRFCFSDASVDRMGDTIAAEGWDTKAFEKNPVALWAHDSSALPVGRASNLGVEEGRLMGDIEFASADLNPFAESVYRMVRGGFLNACSVGFMPRSYEFSNEDGRPYGIDFKEQELLEISVCPVPANAGALAEARAKGIDTKPLTDWAEKTLSAAGRASVTKTELKRLRAAAKTLRSSDGVNETDPASGGALVGNCGRKDDDECGLKDPMECQVHGRALGDEDSDKLLDDVAQLLEELEKHMKVKPRRREAEDARPGDGDGDDMGHEECVRMAQVHFKAADALYDAGEEHYAKAMDHLAKAVDTLDGEAAGNPEAEEGEGESKTLKKARDLLARAKAAR